MTFRFELRCGLSSEWAAKNPILLRGEPGYETDTHIFAIGDGVTRWLSLKKFVDFETTQGLLATSGSNEGTERWYGPYLINYDTPNLHELPGHLLFTPKIGDWLVDFRCVVREPFVNPEGGMARFAIGWWNDSGIDLFGTDGDVALSEQDTSSLPLINSDLMQLRSMGGGPAQFLSTDPLYINIIDGVRDPLDQERPQPIYNALSTAGRAELYFKIQTGSISTY